MAEAVYRYWCGLPVTDDLLDVDMISDVDMKAKFQLVAEAANDAAFHVAVNDISDWASNNGFDNLHTLTLSQQDTFVKQLLRQYVLYRSVKFLLCVCSVQRHTRMKCHATLNSCLLRYLCTS